MPTEISLTAAIQKAVCKSEVLKYNLPCENVSGLFEQRNPWEMDVVSLNKGGFLSEFEIKISRQDFKKDCKKDKWQFYALRIESLIPNYFYYVCPPDLIRADEIQDFAGLIYVDGATLTVVKKAKMLHKEKRNRVSVLQTFCRILSERTYLDGMCRMTYNNKKLKSLN